MKKKTQAVVMLFITAVIAISMAACGKQADEKIDVQALMQTLLQKVSYDTELLPNEDGAEIYFADLPEGTVVTRYAGSGYYADELILLELPNEKDGAAAKQAMTRHLGELRFSF